VVLVLFHDLFNPIQFSVDGKASSKSSDTVDVSTAKPVTADNSDKTGSGEISKIFILCCFCFFALIINMVAPFSLLLQ
jgi:hypothetical protein